VESGYQKKHVKLSFAILVMLRDSISLIFTTLFSTQKSNPANKAFGQTLSPIAFPPTLNPSWIENENSCHH
jgi:hypothetical protein